MHTVTPSGPAARTSLNLQRCLDALERGACTEEEFLLETLEVPGRAESAAWDVLASLDQRYRRGQLPETIFNSLKVRIAQHALNESRDGNTIELPQRHGRRASRRAERGAAIAARLAAARPSEAPVPAPWRAPVHVGRTLCDRYQVVGLIGRGGMGDVFKVADACGATRAEAPSHVAIKVLRERAHERPELMVKLQREFDCIRKLSHPNVVKVFDFYANEEFAFYTMELLDGEHAGDLLARELGHPLPRPYAWGIIRAVGAALAHAHGRNVIHGDVSPKNIMITRDGAVRVLDFGSSTMSHVADIPATAPSRVTNAATPAYASCELLDGQAAEERDDLYSLACLAYELLAGEHPFQRRRATDARAAGLLAQRPAGISRSQWRTLQRGLSWSRTERSVSIRRWLADLGLEPEPETLPATTDPAQGTAARTALAPALRWAAGIAGLAVLLAWLLFSGSERPDVGPEATPLAPGQPAAPGQSTPGGTGPAPTTPDAKAASARPVLSAAEKPSVLGQSAADAEPTAHPQRTEPATREAVGLTPPRTTATSATPPPRRDPTRAPQPSIRFAVNRQTVQPTANFVELTARRTRVAAEDGAFLWWTQDGGARGGVDFVPQAPTRHAFADGRKTTSIFVRVLPHADRAAPADFRVCLGREGAAGVAGDGACATIVLPGRPRATR